MTVPELGKTWRKSSYSSQGGDCVEVEGSLGVVRDSKNPAAGELSVDVLELVRAIQGGQLR